jgi:hypothetical protein
MTLVRFLIFREISARIENARKNLPQQPVLLVFLLLSGEQKFTAIPNEGIDLAGHLFMARVPTRTSRARRVATRIVDREIQIIPGGVE